MSLNYNTRFLTVFMWSNSIPFKELVLFSPNFLPLIPQASCRAYTDPHPTIWLLTRFYRVGPISIKQGNHLYLITQTCLAMKVQSRCQAAASDRDILLKQALDRHVCAEFWAWWDGNKLQVTKPSVQVCKSSFSTTAGTSHFTCRHLSHSEMVLPCSHSAAPFTVCHIPAECQFYNEKWWMFQLYRHEHIIIAICLCSGIFYQHRPCEVYLNFLLLY